MKRVILLASLIFLNSYFFDLGAEDSTDYQCSYVPFQKIEDGWYTANVKYYDTSTYKRTTNTLKVRVESNRVTAIDFINGIVIHAGNQNSGYFYSGGFLSYNRAYNSSHIIGVSGKVIVSYNNGVVITYDINIR